MISSEAARAQQLAGRITFGIVTALDDERAAVLAMLDGPVPYPVPGSGAGRMYDLGEIPALGGGTHVIALALAGVGNNIAAARGSLLLEHFPRVESILMVGIAGGVPSPDKAEAHVRLGDIVVSDGRGIIQFDFVKKTRSHVDHRHPPRPPGARMLESVTYLASDARAGKRPWEALIGRANHLRSAARPPAESDVVLSTVVPDQVLVHPLDSQRIEGMPRIFQGAIASSGALLKDAEMRDRLRDEFGVKAVEMEASGIADATWTHGVSYLAIRGICDYCDENKNDRWHVYAAVVAAAYARALLERTASQVPPTPTQKKRDKSAPVPPHNLAPRRIFVGRDEELRAIGGALEQGHQATISHGQASVYGLGGVGKTALALEYAWRNLARYRGGIYWIDAHGRPVDALAQLSIVLRTTGPVAVRRLLGGVPRTAPVHELAAAACSALQNQREESLLILDNVSEDGFADMSPAEPVRVLLTTRDERFGLGHTALLEMLSVRDAQALAERLAGAPKGEAELEALDRVVVTELGGLAVAVEMAALAVNTVHGWAASWRGYERALQKRAKDLMSVREPHSRYPISVMAALDLSIDRCERGSHERKLLEGMAIFAPAGVPMEWAVAAAGLNANSVELKKARVALKSLGLVTADPERKTLSMHRLVHRRVRERAVEGRPLSWIELVLPWTNAGKGDDERERIQAWGAAGARGAECVVKCLETTGSAERGQRVEVEALRPHIEEALAAAERCGNDRAWITIADRLARHLQQCAQFSEARSLFEQTLKKEEQIHPPVPGFVAARLTNLAGVMEDLDERVESLPLYERALAIDEDTYGSWHPRVATALSHLAHALRGLEHRSP